MTGSFITRIARENRDLFRLTCRFCFQPARYIHVHHLSELMAPELLERLRGSIRGQERLSQWISRQWSLDAPDPNELESPSRRLAALPYDTLDRLVSLSGAAMYGIRIARVVDRETQVCIKQALGDDYAFAVKRAPFLVKDLPERLTTPIGSDPRRQIDAAGRACLWSCFVGCSAALRQRLALKFPPGTPVECNEKLNDSERTSVWKSLKRILISELDPAVASCFD